MDHQSRLIFASDTTAWDHCPRHAWYLMHPPAEGEVESDPFEVLIQAMGDAYEAEILASFADPVEAESVNHTRQLIAEHTPVIYQPKFVDEQLGVFGAPDFLLYTPDGYRVADVKLALSVEKNRSIQAQMGVYRMLAGSDLPVWVYLGNGELAELDDDIDERGQQFLRDMQALVTQPDEPDTHYSYSKCAACPFSELCLPDFKAADELTLSPAVDARAAKQLRAQGISDTTSLARMKVDDIQDAPYLKGPAKKDRIIKQAVSLKTGRVFKQKPIDVPAGTMVHFDVESDPLTANGTGEVYLWGFLRPPYDEGGFEAVWRESDDYSTWRAFLSLVSAYRDNYSNLRLVHYSPYERVQIKHYAARYDEQTDPTVVWLLDDDGPLWDLQRFVKERLILPVSSYGLKSICRDPRLVNFQWRLPESGSQWSVVRYYDYLAAESPSEAEAIRREIEIYNEDDVRATAAMVEWISAL